MTPEEFQDNIVPQLLSSWEENCFCNNPNFLKLLSFNFEDYGLGPIGLADSEAISDVIIRKNFIRDGEPGNNDRGDTVQRYSCPKCGDVCTERYAEFSISMYRSYFMFEGTVKPSPKASYLIGYYGFDLSGLDKISDFEMAASTQDFLESLAPNE